MRKFRTPVGTGVENGTVYVICDDGSAWVFPSSIAQAFNDLPEKWIECSPIPGSQRAQEKETDENRESEEKTPYQCHRCGALKDDMAGLVRCQECGE